MEEIIMIERIEGIAVNQQREFLEAENKAHDELVKAGFCPKVMTLKRKRMLYLKEKMNIKEMSIQKYIILIVGRKQKKNYVNETTV